MLVGIEKNTAFRKHSVETILVDMNLKEKGKIV